MSRLDLKGSAEQLEQMQFEKDRREVEANSKLRLLLKARPSQIDQWVENNVTNLNEAQEAIKFILQAVVILGRREFK